jgi:hypothetical protein
MRISSSVRGRRCRSLRSARRGFLNGQDADEASLSALVLEEHNAVDQREQRIVLGATDVPAGLVVRAALPDQDAAAGDGLPAKSLDSEPLALRVASVSR